MANYIIPGFYDTSSGGSGGGVDSSPTPTPTPTDKFYPNNVINIKAIPNNGQITIS